MQSSILKKFIITSVITLAGISISLYAFIAASASLRDYRTTLTATITRIAVDEKDFNRLTKISDILKTRSSDIQRFQAIAVDRQRPLKFIETMEQIGHLTSTKVALSINQGGGDPAFLSFGATLEGTETNVHAMLGLIQALPYQISIENITFQRDISTNSPQPIVHIVLVLRIATQ